MTIIKIEELLNNEPRELYIESLDAKVKVRDPTTEDKINVRKEARSHPLWDEMNEMEKADEISKRLALKIIVEPEITYEDYKKCTSPKIDALIEAVLLDWDKRVTKFTEKTRKELRSFLRQMREKSPKGSMSS